MKVSTLDSDLNSTILLLELQGLMFKNQTFFDDYNELYSSNSLMDQIENDQTSENPSLSYFATQTSCDIQSFDCIFGLTY